MFNADKFVIYLHCHDKQTILDPERCQMRTPSVNHVSLAHPDSPRPPVNMITYPPASTIVWFPGRYLGQIISR